MWFTDGIKVAKYMLKIINKTVHAFMRNGSAQGFECDTTICLLLFQYV